MKKTKTAKAFAIFALLGIILSIVWTGILVLTSSQETDHSYNNTLTPEKLQEILKNNPVLNTNTGTSVTVKTSTWETK